MELMEITREEAMRFMEAEAQMTGWKLVEVPWKDGSMLVGVVHPHTAGGLEYHKHLIGRISQFKVGDFVRYVGVSYCGYMSNGDYGRVIAVEPNYYGVEFAKPFDGGHDLGGRTKDKHGCWILCDQPNLELAD